MTLKLSTFQAAKIMLKVAIWDLRHEWILSLCLVIAIAAIGTPLLLTHGLRQGVMSLLRERLVQDPTFREFRPATTLNQPRSFFESIGRRADIEFIVPTTTRGAATARLAGPGGRSVSVDVTPTDDGDPLLLQNSGQIPRMGDVTVSAAVASALATKVGDTVHLVVTRQNRGRTEQVREPLEVVSILESRADGLPTVYIDLALAMDIERYREGFGAEERGWPGATPEAYASFDGVIIATPVPISSPILGTLSVASGFTTREEISAEVFSSQLGFSPVPTWHLQRLSVTGDPVGTAAVGQVRERLRGLSATLFPYVKGVRLAVGLADPIEVVGLSPSRATAVALGLLDYPWWGDTISASHPPFPLFGPPQLSQTDISAEITDTKHPLRLPFRSLYVAPDNRAYVPIELAGQLRTAQLRPVNFDPGSGELRLERPNYHGFRAYAKRIEDVPAVYNFFSEQGIETIAHVTTVQRILTLDASLFRVFTILLLIGACGAFSTILASLYSSVVRKERQLGMLRLLGVERWTVAMFPLFQAVLVTIGAVCLSCTLAASSISVIQSIVLGQIAGTPPSSFLGVRDYAAGGIIALFVSAVGALAASVRCTVIDPGDALRAE